MAIELQLNKNDDTSWGFRLTGGADYGVPLTVIKVAKGSLAEEAGMQLGDVVVRIENYCTANLSHADAHDIILAAGKHFNLAVRRGTIEELENLVKEKIANNELSEPENDNFNENNSSASNEMVSEENGTSGMSYTPPEEIEIVNPENCMNGNHAMNGHGIDNPKKLKDVLPKVGEKKWSTFLIKPNRPKPVKKPKGTELPKEPPYRVKIIKGKPKSTKKEEEKPDEIMQQPEHHQQQLPDIQESKSEPDIQVETSYKENENGQETQKREESNADECHQNGIDVNDCEENVRYYDTEDSDNNHQYETEPIVSQVEMTVEEQLAQVQQQLLALSQLPIMIQSTLDSVTQQLAKLLPVKAQVKDDEDTYDPTTTTVTATSEAAEESDEEPHDDNLDTVPEETEPQEENDENVAENGVEQDVTDYMESCEPAKEVEIDLDAGLTEEEREAKRLERERIDKLEKEKLAQQEEFHQRRLEQRPTRSMPTNDWIERPIILPGGRKWSGPNDTVPRSKSKKMTEEFIAETISCQTEVITGHTLGESNCRLVPSTAVEENRVNFLKYQPPPKNMDYLRNSEVYKLIHDLEAPPTHGVAARKEKVMSAQDYYSNQDSCAQIVPPYYKPPVISSN